MSQKILYIFTRTPLHVGAGASVGAIDQPIQRERHTGFPIIPGSSIKGVLRDAARRDDSPDGILASVDAIFGMEDDAGRLSFGDAKILAFPIRSAKGGFAFVTCPLVLERFQRENANLQRIKVPTEPSDMLCLAGEKVSMKRGENNGVVLEEYRFNKTGPFPPEWESNLLDLIEDPVWKAGKGRFVLLSNGDFAYFVKNACEVSQHVSINPSTGTAKTGALFNLEAVPAETLFFASLVSLPRSTDGVVKIANLLSRRSVVQFGGDATTGLGFCSTYLS